MDIGGVCVGVSQCLCVWAGVYVLGVCVYVSEKESDSISITVRGRVSYNIWFVCVTVQSEDL